MIPDAMIKPLFFFLAGALLLLAETTVPFSLPGGGVPELHYLLVMYLAFQTTVLLALTVIAPLGLLLDAVSGVLPGYHTAFCTLSFLTIRLLVQRHSWLRGSSLRLPLLGLNHLLISGLFFLILAYFKPDTMRAWSWLTLPLQALLLVILAAPCFRFFNWIERFTDAMSFGIRVFSTGNRKQKKTWDSGR
ncbi:MAG: hypothetical protein BWK76_00170 [Desulfobulbaceae bacterium A2]|nr:MAG: hypothetical protein BWK76_00170 [Desulfobulbaceae bacterium A2]